MTSALWVGWLSLQVALGQLVFAFDRGDASGARDAFLELVVRPDRLDEQCLEGAPGQFIARHMGAGSPPSTTMFTDLFSLVSVYELAMLPEVAAVFWSLATLEGTLAGLAPGFDSVTEARAFARAAASDKLHAGPIAKYPPTSCTRRCRCYAAFPAGSTASAQP